MAGAFLVGDWHVEPSLRTLSNGDREVRLEPKVMQVLVTLAERAGQVVSKDELLHTVWVEAFVSDEVLSRTISELRRILADDARSPRYVHTIPKGGYRLVAPVRFLLEPVPAIPAPKATGEPGRRSRPVVVLLLIASAAIAFWGRQSRPPDGPLETRRLTSSAGKESSPTFSPDGSRIAFAGNPVEGQPSRIFVKTISDDPPVQLSHGPGDDGGPAWSPDGLTIAFARTAGDASGIYVIPSIGGSERRLLAASGSSPRDLCLCRPNWSPDGQQLVYAWADPTRRRSTLTSMPACRVAVLSLQTMQVRYLTGPPADEFDSMPAYSPDGRIVAFVRYHESWRGDVFLVSAQGGAATRLTHDDTTIPGNLAWTPDGKSLVFASARRGGGGIWRVPIAGGEPVLVAMGGTEPWSPAIDATGHRIVFEQHERDCELSAVDLRDPSRPAAKVASSTECESGASFSPDGRQLAIERNAIWVADRDGANARRLTHMADGPSGTPRWSPDGQRIVFDSAVSRGFAIFTVHPEGGTPTRVVDGNAFVPSWSRDGRWIYFASNRSGVDQVWKAAADRASPPVQITRLGGFGGEESVDGRWFYYTKHTTAPGIWRVPVGGGREEPVIPDQPGPGFSRDFAVTADAIYFIDASDRQHPTIARFDLRAGVRTAVATLPKPVTAWASALAISPDEGTAIVSLQERDGADLMLVDHYH